MKLTDKVRKFIENYLMNGGNGSKAYRESYNAVRMNDKTVTAKASLLLRDDDVMAAIEKVRLAQAQRAITKASDITAALLDIASADITKIVQYRRTCCRFCYGKKHQYQWLDADEYGEACALVLDGNVERAKAGKKAKNPPSDAGGYGFRFNLPPAANCPRCLGEGKGEVFIADTASLPAAERRLIAGIKKTREGIEIKFRDQDAALVNAGKMMGGFKQIVVIETEEGKRMKEQEAMPVDSTEASKAYAAILRGVADE